MKTIGLVTCYLDNYGACLQAHALQHIIDSFGYACEIINYTEPYGYVHTDAIASRISHNVLVRKILSIILPGFRTRYRQEEKFNQFRKKHLTISSHQYKTTKSIMQSPPVYDAYVCGSDQIWNPMFYEGNNKVYLLSFVPEGKKKVAYAPSIGLSFFPTEYAVDFKVLLERFDAISVRETEGQEILKQMTDKTVPVVLDPTLLCDDEYWSKLAVAPKNVTKEKPYVFCYIFGNKPYMHSVIARVQRETGCEVLYTSFTIWGSEMPHSRCVDDVGPGEFLWLIKNAETVITDSFHATAFSINFKTPFYTLLRNDSTDKVNMNSRIYSILSMAYLSERMIESYNESDELCYQVDFTNAEQELDKKRETDKNFLFNALR